jgi:TetR/AcrR family transcriptional regulator, lmrAB and yxaGH operons repressor
MLSSMAERGKTRKQLVASTVELLRRQGAYGTGLHDVLDHSGAPRGSLYFHFPGGKEELIREALQDAADVVDRALEKSLDRHRNVAEAMADFLTRYGHRLEESNFTGGCPVAAVALDVAAEGDRLRTACDWALSGWVSILAERLREEGRDPDEAEALALTALSALEGALILSRARRSAGPLHAVAGQLQRLLS